jgi:hypothetical protein
MAASMKMTAFWNIAPCGLIEVDRHFRGAYCFQHQGDVIALMMEAIGRCRSTSQQDYMILNRRRVASSSCIYIVKRLTIGILL